MKKAMVLALAAMGALFVSSSAFAALECPVGKSCGLTPQDGTVMATNMAISIGKSNSAATVCNEFLPVQSVVIVAPGGGQAAVLATAARNADVNPGTRVTVEIETDNFCTDASTMIAYKRWEGTAQ